MWRFFPFFPSFVDHLALMFEDLPPWDVDGKYHPQNLQVRVWNILLSYGLTAGMFYSSEDVINGDLCSTVRKVKHGICCFVVIPTVLVNFPFSHFVAVLWRWKNGGFVLGQPRAFLIRSIAASKVRLFCFSFLMAAYVCGSADKSF